MSGFTKTVTFETPFDGDNVTVVLARLTRNDMAKFAPYIQDAREGGGVMRFDSTMELMSVSAEILPSYIKHMEGLFDGEGVPVDMDTMLSESYFMKLVSDIVAKLVEISSPNEEDQKNSEGQPSDTSKDSEK